MRVLWSEGRTPAMYRGTGLGRKRRRRWFLKALGPFCSLSDAQRLRDEGGLMGSRGCGTKQLEGRSQATWSGPFFFLFFFF